MKKIIKVLVALLMVASLIGCNDKTNIVNKDVNTNGGELSNKTIILHTNDVHGSIDGYAYLPELKKDYENKGATVIMVDAGDYTNGTIYVSSSKGESAITLMNEVGYDIVSLGNHEFDFGLEKLKSNLANVNFKVLCANVFEDNKSIYDAYQIIKIDKLKIGFFALVTPEILTKSNPDLVKGLTIPQGDEFYLIAQKQIDFLKKKADIVICISHLGIDDESIGNRSYDLWNNTKGIDFIIDGHSHTVMANGENEEPIQSTGTAFENIGVITIDNETKTIESNELFSLEGYDKKDEIVLAIVKNITETIDEEYEVKVAKTEVDLNGAKADVRSKETNLGDLISDAILWCCKNETTLKVDDDHIVTIINGGGIRASINKGDISKKDILTVLPFGNNVSVNYITGNQLLEVLEASTFSSPELLGGFPHISGMKITIDTSKKYDQGDKYPDSTYYGPKSINRVTIDEINGKPFNKDDTYAIVTSNFSSAGGDTYYALRSSRINGNAIDLPITLDSAVTNYIVYELAGIVSDKYRLPQGRITIK